MKTPARTFLATTAVALSFGLAAQQAAAACSVSGKITRTYSYSAGANDYGFVYIFPETSGVPSTIYYAYIGTDDDRAANAISAAHSANHTVTLNGNATACPTTGTYRYIGSLNYAYAYSGR